MNWMQSGDSGTAIVVTILVNGQPADISNATVKKLIARDEDGNVHEFDADFVTDGTDGQLRYITQEGDIVRPGNWQLQALLDIGTTWTGHSKPDTFQVFENIDG